MDFTELKNRSPQELKELLAEKRGELLDLRFKMKSGQVKQVQKMPELKKDIARITMLMKIKQ